MFTLSGVLAIRTIEGRYGPFNVARLTTELGEFAVKDTLLDQYAEGKYAGEFGISRIYPAHYLTGGRLVIEVRATLETLALAGIDALTAEDATPTVEPDPIDETAAAPAEPAPPAPSEDDVDLFGALWPLGPQVKLDPTVDRARFRRQKTRLDQLGYTFQPLGQIWEKSAAHAA